MRPKFGKNKKKEVFFPLAGEKTFKGMSKSVTKTTKASLKKRYQKGSKEATKSFKRLTQQNLSSIFEIFVLFFSF